MPARAEEEEEEEEEEGPQTEKARAGQAGGRPWLGTAMKRDRRGRFLPAEEDEVAVVEIEPTEPPDAAAGLAKRRRQQQQQQEAHHHHHQPRQRRQEGRPGARPAVPSREEPRPEGEQQRQEEELDAAEAPRWASSSSSSSAAAATGLSRGLSTGYCRLCHGKFSSRSLRNAFGKVPVMSENTEKQKRLDRIFFADFQRLVGVTAQQDPSLPQFVCKKCHAQFYKCRSILMAFIQKVNFSPASHLKPRGKNNVVQPSPPVPEENASSFADLITSSPQCLHQLVMWTHNHAETCQVAPSLQSVLSSGYRGIIQAVWGCRAGHDYVMSTDVDCSTLLVNNALSAKWKLNRSASEHMDANGVDTSAAGTLPGLQPNLATSQPSADSGASPLPVLSPADQVPKSHNLPSLEDVPRATFQTEGPACSLNGSPEPLSEKPLPPEASDERVKDEFSELSEGDSLSEEEENHNENKRAASSDDFFPLYPEKRVSSNRKAETQGGNLEEAKVKKKPGPKPGWKKKIKGEREELPTIFKCPYQGCTAVYRGADGMKKHIKEHHEEVRERPCPHPGCNKVFMIDRYLQRHVKLIHTEVRNYICDECGHTFKQRKHLSVHQMRHSGAKPLQCEICGFQCRQRASLKYHMTKHKAETELEFACDQCGKRFEKAHNLNVHMSMVHPLTQAQDKPKAMTEGQCCPVPEAAVVIATATVVALGTAENQPVKVELCTQQHELT